MITFLSPLPDPYSIWATATCITGGPGKSPDSDVMITPRNTLPTRATSEIPTGTVTSQSHIVLIARSIPRALRLDHCESARTFRGASRRFGHSSLTQMLISPQGILMLESRQNSRVNCACPNV